MKNTLLTIVAVLAAVFPFAMVALELVRATSLVTVAVFLVIAVTLAITVVVALNARPQKS
jgi:hypothetical protein